jgi:hypothetical protein
MAAPTRQQPSNRVVIPALAVAITGIIGFVAYVYTQTNTTTAADEVVACSTLAGMRTEDVTALGGCDDDGIDVDLVIQSETCAPGEHSGRVLYWAGSGYGHGFGLGRWTSNPAGVNVPEPVYGACLAG